MTTTDHQPTTAPTPPAWLNLDAFNLPADHVAEMQEVANDTLELARELALIVARAQRVDAVLVAAKSRTDCGDEVSEAVDIYTGVQGMHDLLGVVQRLAGEFTMSGETVDPHFGKQCEQYGIDLTDLDVGESKPFMGYPTPRAEDVTP